MDRFTVVGNAVYAGDHVYIGNECRTSPTGLPFGKILPSLSATISDASNSFRDVARILPGPHIDKEAGVDLETDLKIEEAINFGRIRDKSIRWNLSRSKLPLTMKSTTYRIWRRLFVRGCEPGLISDLGS